MSLLYDSNISKTLELKETVDVITDSIISLKQDPKTFKAIMPTRWTIGQKVERDFNFYVYRKDSVFNKVLANIFQDIKRDGLSCLDLETRITLFVDSTIQKKANSIFGPKNSVQKRVWLYSQVQAASSFFVSYYKNQFIAPASVDHSKEYSFQKRKHESITGGPQTYSSKTSTCEFGYIGIENILLNAKKEQNFINVNTESSFENPHMSVTMINSPAIKGSSQNEIEMHTFLNAYNSIEFSKCIPYVDVKMNMPRYNKKYEPQYRSNASMSSFFYPDKNLTPKFDFLLNKTSEVPVKGSKDENITFEEINIGTFTMPQTAVNLNTEKFGRAENYSSEETKSPIIPHDLTRPFMTIKKLDLDVVVSGGLMAYKSGTLSLLLHDRARMRQIASFIDPALQGGNGPRVTLEFGWSHPAEKGNILGKFLNESKVKETFMIQNSNFNMESDGSVNIDLNISQISGRIFTKVKFNKDPELINKIKHINDFIGFVKEDVAYLSGSYTELDTSSSEVNLSMFSLDRQNLNKESAKKINDLITKIKTSIDRFSNNPTSDNYQKITNLVTGKKIKIDNPEEIKNKKKEGFESTIISDLKDNLESLRKRIENARKMQEESSRRQSRSLIEKIIPNVKEFDPFFDDVLWKYLIEDKKTNITKENFGDYVTFGSIVSGLIATHIPAEKVFTDIQLFSYTCNSNCGYMSNRNIFSILIKLADLEDKITKIVENNLEFTLEQFLTDVYTSLIQTEENHSWGIHHIFESTEKKGSKLRKGFKGLLDTQLANIHKKLGLPTIDNKVELRIPALSYVFNSKTNKDNKYIFKASFYDKLDNPFKTLSDIANSVRVNKIKSTVAKFRFENAREIDAARFASSPSAKEIHGPPMIIDRYLNVNKDVINENLAKNLKKIKTNYIDTFFTSTDADDKTTKLELKPEFDYDNLKEAVKSTLPSITYGTENSAVTSMSLTSMNESGLTEVKLAEMNRRKERLYTESKINANLPLKIFPTSASVELIGCPFINFNQAIFLDFQTGTIADNTYITTGIKHTLTPGKFNTSLTLTPRDAYGYYESHIKGLESLINSDLSAGNIESLLKLEDKKNKVRSKKTKIKTSKSKAKRKTATVAIEEGDNCLVKAAKKFNNNVKDRFSISLVNHAWNNFKVHVDKYAAKFNIEPTLIWSVMAIESSFKVDARNAKSGATGLMQFIHKTAISNGLRSFENAGDKNNPIDSRDERIIPERIIFAGAKYLSYLSTLDSEAAPLLTTYNDVFFETGDKLPYEVILSSYNAGPHWTLPAFNGYVKKKGTRTVIKRPGVPFPTPRKWAFDITKTHYIDPILTFKDYLDKCLNSEDGKAETSTESTTIKKPAAAIAKNDDDDVKNSEPKKVVKVKKGKKVIVALEPEIEEEEKKKVKAKEKVLSKGKVPIDKLTQDVYLFTPSNQFKVFAYLCLAYPVFKKKDNTDEFGDVIDVVDFIIRENISNKGNASITNLVTKGFEDLAKQVYEDDAKKSPLAKSSLFIENPSLIKYHNDILDSINDIQDIYNRHKNLFNKRIEHGASTRGYNLTSALIAENTSNFSYTEYFDKDKKEVKAYVSGNASKESRDYFDENINITLMSDVFSKTKINYDPKNPKSDPILEQDVVKAIKNISKNFYLKNYVSLFQDIYAEAYDIQELLYSFVRYAFITYESFLVFKDKVDINSNIGIFNESILRLKSFSPKIHSKVTNTKEYKIIKSSLKRKNKFIEESFYINKIIYASEEEKKTRIDANIINYISNSLLKLAYKNAVKSKDVIGMFGFVNTNIIIPDISSVGLSDKKFKRYFEGSGVLIALEASTAKYVGASIEKYLSVKEKQKNERSKDQNQLIEIFDLFFETLFEDLKDSKIKSIIPYIHTYDTNNTLVKNSFYIYVGTKEFPVENEVIAKSANSIRQSDKKKLEKFKAQLNNIQFN